MKKIYNIAQALATENKRIALATLLSTSGSVPQVTGASAIYSEKGLLAGTLGGGIMEGDAQRRAIEAIHSGKHHLYDFLLDSDIKDKAGALCGGNATILIDPDPGKHLDCFGEMTASMEKGRPGLMLTCISEHSEAPVRRYWLENGHTGSMELPKEWTGVGHAVAKTCNDSMHTGKCSTLQNDSGDLLFFEPVFPVPKLVIAGAGHVGKALSHMGSLLDFEVTVIDDRPEYANPENLPDADHIIVQSIGKAMDEIPKTADTYVVIVTRGHHDDAAALKPCIRHPLAYLGMIGSRKKIRTMKEQFLGAGWATTEEFERVHAPIGIEIGSLTVQEIALSISAQLVQERAAARKGMKREQITTVILAAGESRRMGEPKMLLPFGDASIIRTVISNALHAVSDHVRVVLGADADRIQADIADLKAEQVLNRDFRNGMLSSVQAGIRNLPHGTTAVMILLGDQPMISSQIMDQMITRYKQSDKNIIIASVDGKRGHPMIFNAAYIPEILAYGPGESLKNLSGRHPEEVEEYETGKPEILRDIDTPQDYENEIKNS